MLSITKLSILSKPKGAMDEILNNEKQVVLLVKVSVSIQLSVLANNEPSPLSCPLSSALLFVLSPPYQKWIYILTIITGTQNLHVTLSFFQVIQSINIVVLVLRLNSIIRIATLRNSAGDGNHKDNKVCLIVFSCELYRLTACVYPYSLFFLLNLFILFMFTVNESLPEMYDCWGFVVLPMTHKS